MPGTVSSAQPKNERKWSLSSKGANAEATAQTTLQPLKNYVLPLMPSCSSVLLQMTSTHFILSYLLNLLSSTTWDCMLATWHYQINTVLLTVVTLWLECCMPIVT